MYVWFSGFFSVDVRIFFGTSRFLNIQIVFRTSRFFLNIWIFGGTSGFYTGNLRIFFYLFLPPDFSLYVRFYLKPPDFIFENLQIIQFFLTSGFFAKPPDVFEHPDLFENVQIFWGTSGCFAQVFRSGNLLLHHPSNSHYCVSLRQLATTSWAETSAAWWIFLSSSIFRFSIAAPQVRRYFVQLTGQSVPVQINGQGNGQGA